jgi:DNA-binding NarL/FixJ family response regulator
MPHGSRLVTRSIWGHNLVVEASTNPLINVLIVDDQESFRSAARMVVDLTDGFILAGEAPTGEDGVRLAQDLAPDLVLMDINLPGIDGLEATRLITTSNPMIRIVVLSTYEAGEYQSRALESGACAFLSKTDFEPAKLAEIWEAIKV